MIRRGWLGAATLLLAACGSKGPIAPTPTAPQIACPADAAVSGITGGETAVMFPAPTVTGGTAPVNVTCTQSSGTSFPLGTTSVSCTARDAAAREAACGFKITVTGLILSVTKYDAVGDSITQGENALPTPAFIDTPNAYPTKLQALFDATYPNQGITVVNHGAGSERIERTLELLAGYLNADRPQAVLLLGGYNNLTSPCEVGRANSGDCRDAINSVAIGVRDCIREIKESPVGIKYIFVSTLTPPGSVAPTSRDRRIDGDAILEVNRRIRLVVAAEAATLVDSHPLFTGHEAEYISVDGLHLLPDGYQAIADAFFTAIKSTVPQTPLFTVSGFR